METHESSTMDTNDTENIAIAGATAAELNVRYRPQPGHDLQLTGYVARTPTIEVDYSKFYRTLYSSSSSDDSGAERAINSQIIEAILQSENITVENSNIVVENVTVNSDNRNNDEEINGHATDTLITVATDRNDDIHNNGLDLPASATNEIISELEPDGARATVVDAVIERSKRDENEVGADNDDILRRTVYYDEGKEHFYEGINLSKTGRMKEAVKAWKIAKSYGFRKANFNLGICYERGLGVQINLEKAIKCFRKASKDGDHAKAMFHYAAQWIKKYIHCPIKLQDRDQIFMKYLESAAYSEHLEAQVLLGEVYMEFGDVVYAQKAVKLFSNAAREKQPMAEYYLGICHERGFGVELKNDRTAFGFYLRAAQAGIPEAQHNIAVFYELGRGGLASDLGKAIHWYNKAAQQGIEFSASEAARLREISLSTGPQVTATSTNPSDGITETELSCFLFTAVKDVDHGHDGDDDL